MGLHVAWLVDAARMAVAGTGKQVIVSPGWQGRGHAGGLRAIEIIVGHHTGTPDRAPGDYPSLNVVQNGRAGLAGPLAQYGLGRSGNVYVIAAGLSYHAGASAYAGFVDLNDEAVGIEAESAGGGGWTPEQLHMYPRLVGACLHYIRRGVDRYASHRTIARPAGRKPDPAGISDDWMRQRAATFLSGASGGGDDVGWGDQIRTPSGKSYPAGELLAWTNHYTNGIPGITAGVAQIAAAVADGDLDADVLAAKLEEAAHAGSRDAVAELILPALQRIQDALDADDPASAQTAVTELTSRLEAVS